MPKEREDVGNQSNGSQEYFERPYNEEEVIKILKEYGYDEVDIREGRSEDNPRRWIFTDKG